MRAILPIFFVVFCACAKVRTPKGGPPDKTPPAVAAHAAQQSFELCVWSDLRAGELERQKLAPEWSVQTCGGGGGEGGCGARHVPTAIDQ